MASDIGHSDESDDYKNTISTAFIKGRGIVKKHKKITSVDMT